MLPFVLLLLVLLQSLLQRVRTGVPVSQGKRLLQAHGLFHTTKALYKNLARSSSIQCHTTLRDHMQLQQTAGSPEHGRPWYVQPLPSNVPRPQTGWLPDLVWKQRHASGLPGSVPCQGGQQQGLPSP